MGFDPWVGRIPWRWAWQPTQVLLPGESHGQRSLVGDSPRGRKELDMANVMWHKPRLYSQLLLELSLAVPRKTLQGFVCLQCRNNSLVSAFLLPLKFYASAPRWRLLTYHPSHSQGLCRRYFQASALHHKAEPGAGGETRRQESNDNRTHNNFHSF